LRMHPICAQEEGFLFYAKRAARRRPVGGNFLLTINRTMTGRLVDHRKKKHALLGAEFIEICLF
jgi:hypothetical protein